MFTSALASEIAENPGALLVDRKGVSLPKDVNPKVFRLQWTTKLQAGRGGSSARVLEGISKGLEEFYSEVVEGLVPFVPSAPRLVSKEVQPEGGQGGGGESVPGGS